MFCFDLVLVNKSLCGLQFFTPNKVNYTKHCSLVGNPAEDTQCTTSPISVREKREICLSNKTINKM